MISICDPRFVRSSSSVHDCPPGAVAEVAFLGRSNVGKSSLINALLNRKLAKSSSTPGKTRLINFFSVRALRGVESHMLVFVDLPGFGYAKVSKMVKRAWDRNLSDFLSLRHSIKVFCHLVDSRHLDLHIDIQIETFLRGIIRPDCKILRVYTKTDKLNKMSLSRLRLQDGVCVSMSDNDSKQTLLDTILDSICVPSGDSDAIGLPTGSGLSLPIGCGTSPPVKSMRAALSELPRI